MNKNDNNEILLRMKQLREYVPISVSLIYQKIANGKFPKQHKIGGTAFWKMSEIQAYIEQGDEWVQSNE